jgi:hypothetical protein
MFFGLASECTSRAWASIAASADARDDAPYFGAEFSQVVLVLSSGRQDVAEQGPGHVSQDHGGPGFVVDRGNHAQYRGNGSMRAGPGHDRGLDARVRPPEPYDHPFAVGQRQQAGLMREPAGQWLDVSHRREAQAAAKPA